MREGENEEEKRKKKGEKKEKKSEKEEKKRKKVGKKMTSLFPFLLSPLSLSLSLSLSSPATAALAGFVPWAETGIKQTLRLLSPRLAWYPLIASKPVYSPLAPLLGWRVKAS